MSENEELDYSRYISKPKNIEKFAMNKISKIPCCKCGKEVIEFTVPNELWNMVMRHDGHETDKEYLCFDCWNTELMEYLARLQSELDAEKEKSKWIPVSDPPKNNDLVLCQFDIDCEVGYWSGEAWLDTGHYEFDIKPSRWLPIPPTEEE